MIYVLAYPEVERHSARRIDRFRANYEPERAQLVPPHITLMFGVKHTDPKYILGLCESLSGNTPEFTVQFVSSEVVYDQHEKAHKILLTCGKGKDLLTELHNQLYKGLTAPN